MSLITICQAVADRVQIARPSTIVGNTAPEAQSLLSYANKGGNSLMKKVVWQDLREEHTFTSISGETQTGILPADFDRIVPETFWNRSVPVLISGPVAAAQWQGLKANSYASVNYPKFAYRGGEILVIPSLAAGQSLAFEYVSNLWALSDASVAQPAFAADTDTTVWDDELITRSVTFEYLDGQGMPSAKALADLDDYIDTLVTNDQPRTPILATADIFGNGRHWNGVPATGGDSWP